MLWLAMVAVIVILVADALIVGRARARGVAVTYRVRFSALAAAFWGLLTGLVFVPGGALLALVLFDGTGATSILALAVSAVCISGLVTAFDLLRAPRALIDNDWRAVRRIARFSAIHHVLVVAVFAVYAMTTHIEMFAFVVICAGLGELIAWWLATTESVAPLPAARALRRKV